MSVPAYITRFAITVLIPLLEVRRGARRAGLVRNLASVTRERLADCPRRARQAASGAGLGEIDVDAPEQAIRDLSATEADLSTRRAGEGHLLCRGGWKDEHLGQVGGPYAEIRHIEKAELDLLTSGTRVRHAPGHVGQTNIDASRSVARRAGRASAVPAARGRGLGAAADAITADVGWRCDLTSVAEADKRTATVGRHGTSGVGRSAGGRIRTNVVRADQRAAAVSRHRARLRRCATGLPAHADVVRADQRIAAVGGHRACFRRVPARRSAASSAAATTPSQDHGGH